MTEKEARTKWCPMTRIGWQGGMAINRHPMDTTGDGSHGVKEETRCIASDCAMWRRVASVTNDSGECGLIHQA